MPRYTLTRRAEQDYREILAFTLNIWGVDQFDTYATLLDNAIDQLVRTPRLGIRRDDICPGYYRYRIGKHYIFYRIKAQTLEVARILHVRRNPSQDLFKDLDD